MLFCGGKDKSIGSKILLLLSAIAAVLAAFGALAQDVYLASTQWLLVSIVLGVWGIYILLKTEFRS